MLRGRVLGGSVFRSARSLLADYDPRQSGYLLLDVRMPRMTGLELQQQLGSTGSGIVASAASTITNVNDFSIGGAARAAETLGYDCFSNARHLGGR
jgi:FixJ family two-component response regulator